MCWSTLAIAFLQGIGSLGIHKTTPSCAPPSPESFATTFFKWALDTVRGTRISILTGRRTVDKALVLVNPAHEAAESMHPGNMAAAFRRGSATSIVLSVLGRAASVASTPERLCEPGMVGRSNLEVKKVAIEDAATVEKREKVMQRLQTRLSGEEPKRKRPKVQVILDGS